METPRDFGANEYHEPYEELTPEELNEIADAEYCNGKWEVERHPDDQIRNGELA